MSVVSSYLLIFILNLSEFNTPIKGQWLNGYKTRTKKTAEAPIFYWTKQTLSETATEDKKDIIKKKVNSPGRCNNYNNIYTNHQSTTKQTLTE